MKIIFQKFSSLTVWILGGNKSKNGDRGRLLHETQIFLNNSSRSASPSLHSQTPSLIESPSKSALHGHFQRIDSAIKNDAVKEKKLGNRKDLELLLREISSEIKSMSDPGLSPPVSVNDSPLAKSFLIPDKQQTLFRLWAELHRRIRLLNEAHRQKYQLRAESLMTEAACVGVTLPPP